MLEGLQIRERLHDEVKTSPASSEHRPEKTVQAGSNWKWGFDEISSNLWREIWKVLVVIEAGEMHCRDMEAKKEPCHSVESYFAVVLSYQDRENETDCQGHLHWADWSRTVHGHPTEFGASNVTRGLIKLARDKYCLSTPAVRWGIPGQVFLLIQFAQPCSMS